MGRILAIDYGKKRVGIAATDPLKLIAGPVGTVETGKVFPFLKSYLAKEPVEVIVVGEPRQMNNEVSGSFQLIEAFIRKLKKEFPSVPVARMDERFTSKIAFQTMIDSGLKKKDRRNKGMVDSISAVLILQSYMDYLEHQKRNSSL